MIHVYFNHQRPEIPEISLGIPMKSTTTCVLNDFGQENYRWRPFTYRWTILLCEHRDNRDSANATCYWRLNYAGRCNHRCLYWKRRRGMVMVGSANHLSFRETFNWGIRININSLCSCAVLDSRIRLI